MVFRRTVKTVAQAKDKCILWIDCGWNDFNNEGVVQ